MGRDGTERDREGWGGAGQGGLGRSGAGSGHVMKGNVKCCWS